MKTDQRSDGYGQSRATIWDGDGTGGAEPPDIYGICMKQELPAVTQGGWEDRFPGVHLLVALAKLILADGLAHCGQATQCGSGCARSGTAYLQYRWPDRA